MNTYNLHTCFPGHSDLWVPRECLLELGAGLKLCVGLVVKRGRSVWYRGDEGGGGRDTLVGGLL